MRRPAIAAVLALAIAAAGTAQNDAAAKPGPAAPAQDGRMAWWREARFGMFIHWGLYAIPAGEWQGKKGHGEWIRDTAHIPVGEYEKLQPQWNPVHFDPDLWASLAAAAGMKYLVITSKHHDGFCLWDSKQTEWDVGNTQNPRDILGELKAACDRHGVRFCTYHSIMDWHHPDYLPRRGWEVAARPAGDADFTKFERYLHAQVSEVIDRYSPAVMWFDGEWESTWNHDRGKRLFALCRELAPTMIVNNRVDVHRGGMGGFSGSSEACGDFATPEQEIPATGAPGVDWESCMTMNSHWGWNQADTKWKSTRELLHNLVDIASKGGNYLLNVGPRADGTLPPKAVERLQELAAWMAGNGESIHGTTASVFDNLPFGRCTVKQGAAATKLYLHVFDWPDDGVLRVPGLANKVAAVTMLTGGTALPFTQQGALLAIELPAMFVTPTLDTVVMVEVPGAPVVFRAPRVAAACPEFVTSTTATVTIGAGLLARFTLDGSAPTADSPVATWPIPIHASCELRVAAFHDGKPVSEIVAQRFTKVAPWPARYAEPPAAGLALGIAPMVSWNTIPDGAESTSLGTGVLSTVATVTCGDKPGENVAHRLHGRIDVPADDVYRFALRSDDGSKLWIDGVLVVDNDGLHGTVEKVGAAPLARGWHAITVVWFNRTGGAELGLKWARGETALGEVPAAALKH